MNRARHIAACLLFLVAPVLAQDSPLTLKVDVQVVSIDVVATDANGLLVNDLKKSDFEIYEDGVLQEIRFFTPVSAAYNVFLLFDVSGSTRNNWRFMQDAVYKFIGTLRPQDRLAMGSFAEGYDVHLSWTGDHTKAFLAVSEVTKHSDPTGTRLYAALERTLRRGFDKTSARRAVIVLTDGQDTEYSHEYDQELKKALKAAREERIPVYFVVLGSGDVTAAPQRFRDYLLEMRTYMQVLAESSGGKILFAKTLNDLMPLYAQIGEALGTSYSLGYIPAADAGKEAYRRVMVKPLTTGVRITQSRNGYTAQ